MIDLRRPLVIDRQPARLAKSGLADRAKLDSMTKGTCRTSGRLNTRSGMAALIRKRDNGRPYPHVVARVYSSGVSGKSVNIEEHYSHA